MSTEIKIPQAGESITEVQIGEWRKSEGDAVERDEIIVEIETDKASMEIPAPADGTLAKITKQAGETAEVGEVIGIIATDGESTASKTAASDGAPQRRRPADKDRSKSEEEQPESEDEAAEKKEGNEKEPAKAKKGEQHGDDKEARKDEEGEAGEGAEEGAEGEEAEEGAEGDELSQIPETVEVRPRLAPPAVQALAEHGLEPSDVEGTGPGGSVQKEDVLRHVHQARARKAGERQPAAKEAAGQEPKPIAKRAPTGERAEDGREEELVPMSSIRRSIARRLVEAQQTAALTTTFNEIDMSAVIELRKRYGEAFQAGFDIKLGFMSFFVRASIEALKKIPVVNAEVRGSQIAYRNFYDIGVAIATDHGLVVPVLRSADLLSFAETERAIAEFAERARAKKLALEDITGGTFTISNGGVYGSLLSTPIINPPQSGILGLHAIQDRPVARQGQVVIRPMMYVALSYDHRIVDGREAVTFLRHIKDAIEEPARILIEI